MCRLQSCWLQSTFSLLLLVVAEAVSAAPVAKLYSALGEPLMAEIPLTVAEQQTPNITVTGGEAVWTLLPVSEQGVALLLSEEMITQPILELTLQAGEMERPLVLFLNPVAPHARTQFLQQLITAHNSGVTQRMQLLQQLEQIQLQRVSERGWLQLPEGVVASRWLLFLMLGGVLALLLLRWWRSAEPVDLGQHPVISGQAGAQNRFDREVAQIEAEIQPPRSSQSQL